jgi:CheY-like chemotaxis protein
MINQDYTILIVDDIEENRDILARRLDKDGFKIETAVDGQQALDTLRSSVIDLVLLDIMMPEVDGINVLDKIRKDKTFDDVAVIMVTAIDNMNVALECLRKGACGYVTKPYEMEQVKKQIRHCLKLEPQLAYSSE